MTSFIFQITRAEINSLRTDKPSSSERRTVKGSKLLGQESTETTDEKKTDENGIHNKDDDSDSNHQVGEIADDRLDKDDNDNDDDSDDDEEEVDVLPEDAVSLFKKLLSIKRKEVEVISKSEAESGNDDNVITPTRILNGRQVSFFDCICIRNFIGGAFT